MSNAVTEGRCGAAAFLVAAWIGGASIMSQTAVATTQPQPPGAQQLILDNGLHVAWEEDHRQPLVAIEARIQGGLRGEGRYVGSGITHFIEHMLFKGTPTRPPGTIDQEVRTYGGAINAFTSFDATGVTLFVESRYLREGMAMLADVLQHALFPQVEFEKERRVIISEIQMNRDDPERRLYDQFWGRHLLEHPYRHPVIGYQPLLERLTVDDLTRFYAAQYHPHNVVISCVGDVDPATFPSLVKELLGGWPRGPVDPAQQLVPNEPPSVGTNEIAVELPVQTAYVMLGVSSTSLFDPELYALDVLAQILGQGDSSRLYDTVVRRRRLADAITAWNYTPYDRGVFVVQFRTDPVKVEAAKAEILGIIEAIKARGVTPAELSKAKRQVSAEHLFSLQTVSSKAADMANSMIATRDPLFSRQYVSRIQAVTAEQVRAAARRYWDASRMTTSIIRPAGAAAGAQGERGDLHPVRLSKTVLANGATVLIGSDRSLPIAGIVMGFRGGVRVEREETEGLSNLAAQMLVGGTRRKNALEIATEVESLGATLAPFSGRDGFGLAMQLLSQDLDRGLQLMHELITESTVPEEELTVQRQLILQQLQAEEDEIFDVGGRLLRRTLYPGHPYRFYPAGRRETVSRLTREQCLEFVARYLVAPNAVIAVFGDVDEERVTRRIAGLLKTLPAKQTDWPRELPQQPLDGIQEASKALEKEQAVIMLGFRGSTYLSPDRDALDVMTAALSGMAGRLFQSVREEHGLSYALGAVHTPGWDPGYVMIYAATKPEEQERVLGMVESELARAAADGLTEEEVAQAKRYLIGQHRLGIQHLVELARRSALDELYGLGFDAWKRYEERINAVTVEMVGAAARRYLTVHQRAQVLVGPNGRVPAK